MATKNYTILIEDGTKTVPGMRFRLDTDSGIYRIGDNNLGISVADTKIVDIATTGITVVGTVAADALSGPLNGTVGAVTPTTGAFTTLSSTSAPVSRGGGAVASNAAFGERALSANTTGLENVAVGVDALTTNTIGNYNTAVGLNALYANLSGHYNTGLGEAALRKNSTGDQNVAVGVASLHENVSGTGNTACGYSALNANIAHANTAVGFSALGSNTSGTQNTAVGYTALQTNITGAENTAVGHLALNAATGGYNTAVGSAALVLVDSGTQNTAVGRGAGKALTTGSYNVAVGQSALGGCVTGSRNVAIGRLAGQYETGDDAFYIDNQDRVNTAGDKAGALLYGTFNATPALQTLTVNATVTIGGAHSSFAALTLLNTVTASAAKARSLSCAATLVASANSDVLTCGRFVVLATPGAFTALAARTISCAEFSVAGYTSPADPVQIDVEAITGTGATNAFALRLAPPAGATTNYLIAHTTPGTFNVKGDGALTTNGGLQTFGANDSGGVGYRQVLVPNV